MVKLIQFIYSCVAVAILTPVGPAFTETSLRGSSYSSKFKVIERRNSTGSEISLSRDPVYIPGLADDDIYRPNADGKHVELAKMMAQKNGVPVDLFLRLIQQESGWNPKALSHKGAIGLTQLMPETARYLGVDPHDVRQNLDGGARYLSQQYKRFRNWRLALAAYNAGPEAVAKYNGVPPYKETQNYVRRILR